MPQNLSPAFATLLVRLGLGLIFIIHGAQKWMDLEGTAGFFGMIGLPAPQVMAYLVAFVELFGGIAVLLGLFTRIASGLISLVMLGAIITVKAAKGFIGGYELDLMLLLVALSLVFSGPGAWAVDTWWNQKRSAKEENTTAASAQ
jgi:putative oxidoreductase